MKKLRSVVALVALTVIVSSCASFKRCAYAGAGRDDWQQKDRVVEALELAPGSRVADLGAGGGYFTFDLARAVGPSGRIYAVDIDPDMLEYIEEEAAVRDLSNIETVRAAEDSPALPEPVDLIFISNTYHHLSDRTNYFSRVKDSLRRGGRIAVVEYDGSSGGLLSLFADHSTDPELMKTEMEEAGYRLTAQPDFLDRQSFHIFAPK